LGPARPAREILTVNGVPKKEKQKILWNKLRLQIPLRQSPAYPLGWMEEHKMKMKIEDKLFLTGSGWMKSRICGSWMERSAGTNVPISPASIFCPANGLPPGKRPHHCGLRGMPGMRLLPHRVAPSQYRMAFSEGRVGISHKFG